LVVNLQGQSSGDYLCDYELEIPPFTDDYHHTVVPREYAEVLILGIKRRFSEDDPTVHEVNLLAYEQSFEAMRTKLAQFMAQRRRRMRVISRQPMAGIGGVGIGPYGAIYY
jgi:hypothetical protein